MRVPDFLQEHQVSFETVIHPPAYTAQKLAKYLHVPGKQVVKSVLLLGAHKHCLAVLPATELVDLDVVADQLGENYRLANADEIQDYFRDCEHGAMTPFGRLYGLKTLLEESIPIEATIVFESQQHMVAIRMHCQDFVKIEQPLRFSFRQQDVAETILKS